MARSLEPQNVSNDDWYYEERGGLLVVHQVHSTITGRYVQTDQFKIPWRMIEETMKRRQARRRKAAKCKSA